MQVKEINTTDIQKIKIIISLLDKQIMKLLKSEEVNEDKLKTFTEIKFEYTKELNNLIRGMNTSKMFEKNNKK